MAHNLFRDEQDNERCALKSIYGDEIEFLSESASDSSIEEGWMPLECVIILHPVRSGGPPQPNPPQVDLRVRCSRQYPKVVPEIRVENWKNISDDNVVHLQSKLEYVANTLKGNVMIFDLAQNAETFLNDCNQAGFESFYEQMTRRHKEEEELQRQLKEAEDEKKKKEIRAQIEHQEQAVKKALRRRRNSSKCVVGDADTLVESPEPHESIGAPAMTDPPVEIFSSKKKEEDSSWMFCEKGQSRFMHGFEHKESLGKGAFGSVLRVKNKLDESLYAIKIIPLLSSAKFLNKKIAREVKLLSRLNHENVVRYYTSWIESGDDVAQFIKDLLGESDKGSDGKNLNDGSLDVLAQDERTLQWVSEASSASNKSADQDVFINICGSKEEFNVVQSGYSESLTNNSKGSEKPKLHIFIQMELCDKSTLRLVIDDGLCEDESRVWRLFREIVEGLCHIHQQGIIHRDLKPVNIFIGHDDHVKIGDFGLATTTILQKQTAKEAAIIQSAELSTLSGSQLTDSSQTGNVGTFLYVAPELSGMAVKYSYNEKVDIFSLGIIFFEMCTPPMATEMERIITLSTLRQPIPEFPANYHLEETSPQRMLMCAMLQHDTDKRPSAQELLQNSAIPPPKREEREVSLMIKQTLSNPQSRSYKHLIMSCFEQDVQPSLDATYNVSSWRPPLFLSALEVVSSRLRNVFQSHGAYSLSPPLFTPAGQVSESSVCLMTRSGCIVYATHNLQIPFARFLAQNTAVCQMKRYAIEKVFRERPAGVHPKENYECGFDIITPTCGDLLPEFEFLCVIWEILKEFPSILNKNCVIYVNHSNIISVMLKSAGIDESKQQSEIITLFKKYGFYHSKTNFEGFLKTLSFTENTISTLIQWMDIEGPLNKVTNIINSFIRNPDYFHTLKTAFTQLETFNNFSQMIGITCPVLVNLGHVRNAHYYSGIMIQVACMQKNKPKQSEPSVLLSGGRYDSLVQHFKEVQSRDDSKANQFVIGFTLSVDKLIFSIDDDDKTKMTDVLVCAIGTISLSRDKLSLLQELWKSGLNSSFIFTIETIDELQNRCKDLGIPAIVLLKETDSGFARVRTLLRDRYYEKKVNYNELLDYLFKYKLSLVESTGSMKHELKIQPCHDGPVITFLTLDKLTSGFKRRYESQILNNVQTALNKLSNKVKVEILALSIDAEVSKALSQQVDLNSAKIDINPILKRYPKQKKVIQKFQDHMDEVSNSATMVFIVYSLIDNVYNVIL